MVKWTCWCFSSPDWRHSGRRLLKFCGREITRDRCRPLNIVEDGGCLWRGFYHLETVPINRLKVLWKVFNAIFTSLEGASENGVYISCIFKFRVKSAYLRFHASVFIQVPLVDMLHYSRWKFNCLMFNVFAPALKLYYLYSNALLMVIYPWTLNVKLSKFSVITYSGTAIHQYLHEGHRRSEEIVLGLSKKHYYFDGPQRW